MVSVSAYFGYFSEIEMGMFHAIKHVMKLPGSETNHEEIHFHWKQLWQLYITNFQIHLPIFHYNQLGPINDKLSYLGAETLVWPNKMF